MINQRKSVTFLMMEEYNQCVFAQWSSLLFDPSLRVQNEMYLNHFKRYKIDVNVYFNAATIILDQFEETFGKKN